MISTTRLYFSFVVLSLLSTPLFCSSARADIVVSTLNIFPMSANDAAGVLRLDDATGTDFNIGTIPAFSSTAGPFSPTDVAIGPNGNIFVADAGTFSILHFDGRTGAPLPSPIGGPDGLFAARPQSTGLTYTSIAFDSAGQLYAADAELGAIRVYNGPNVSPPNGTPGTQVGTLLSSPSSSIASLASIAFDQNGKLLASDRDGGQVFRVDVDTDVDEVIIDAGIGGAFSPAGLLVDSGSGDILIANLFGNNILKYDTNGDNGQQFADVPVDVCDPSMPEMRCDTDGGSFPSDLVFDRDGNVLVAVLGGSNALGAGNGRVVRFDSSGGSLTTLIDELAIPASSLAVIDDLVPADFDGNGVVALSDHDVWKNSLGVSVSPSTGADANGDGLTNLADFTVWRDTLFDTAIDTSGALNATPQESAVVPEPTACALALLALGGWLSCKRLG